MGGLGDATGCLPKILRQLGHDVRIVVPGHGIINLKGYHTTWLSSFVINFMGSQEEITIVEVLLANGTPVYLLQNKHYFDRAAVYGEPDDLERFLLFTLAVMELPKKLNWQPDIIHANDWHTGMVPALINVAYRNDSFYSSCASLFTIHNLEYQGRFDDFFAQRADLYGYFPPLEGPPAPHVL